MTKTTEELHPPGTVDDDGGRRRQVVVVAAVAVLVLVTALIVVRLSTGGDDTTTTSDVPSTRAPAATVDEPTTQAPTTTEAPTTTGRPTTTTVAPSAADALEPFFAAAATLDTRLHAAATAINGGGPPWSEVRQEMANAVHAAELAPVAEVIPAGMPHDLLQAAILVYSDLSSRRHALASFTYAGPTNRGTAELLTELGNGHAAAERFDTDLATLRSLAESTPPIAAPPSGSHAEAEALVYIRFVELANGGCDSRGGAVFTHLPTLDWVPTATPAGEAIPSWDGHVGDLQFSADHSPGGTWDVQFNAC